jgi:hypothetical protein
MHITTDIIKHMPARAMIESYQVARKEVQEAFRLLDAAKKRLGAAFGPCYDRVLPHNCRDYNLEREALTTLEIIRRNAWRGVIEKTQIKHLISHKRKEQLDDQLEKGELPELDVQTLADMLAELGGSVDRYFKEAVQEVFEWLRPRRSGYKTNTEYEIGKKVIISYALNTTYSISFNHCIEHRFVSLDNVFHLLDGKGIAKYPDDAVTKIKAAVDAGKKECETGYYYFRWYRNGNMHLTFKRLDLVAELNRIGGGNRVRSN